MGHRAGRWGMTVSPRHAPWFVADGPREPVLQAVNPIAANVETSKKGAALRRGLISKSYARGQPFRFPVCVKLSDTVVLVRSSMASARALRIQVSELFTDLPRDEGRGLAPGNQRRIHI